MTQHVGRTWRPLLDTAVAAQLLYGAPRRVDERGGAASTTTPRGAAVARRRHDHSRAHRRKKVARRFLPRVLRRRERASGAEAVHVRRPRHRAQRRRAERLARLPQRAPSSIVRNAAARRHRAERLAAGLQRQAECCAIDASVEGATSARTSTRRSASRSTSSNAIPDVIPGSPAARAGCHAGREASSPSTAARYSSRRAHATLVKASASATDPIELILETGVLLQHRDDRLPRRRALSAPRAHRSGRRICCRFSENRWQKNRRGRHCRASRLPDILTGWAVD